MKDYLITSVKMKSQTHQLLINLIDLILMTITSFIDGNNVSKVKIHSSLTEQFYSRGMSINDFVKSGEMLTKLQSYKHFPRIVCTIEPNQKFPKRFIIMNSPGRTLLSIL